MKISYNWLKKYLPLDQTRHSPAVIAEVLPLLGFEVETCETLGPPPLEQVVVGEVIEFAPHPDADRLRCCKVRTDLSSDRPHSIVCGAKNFAAGDRVLVALPGAILPGNFKIKQSRLRGQPSEGMMCSAKELQISEENEGILILNPDVPLGTPVNQLYTDSDTVFDLEVTPNRVDVLSHIGVARELAARFGLAVNYPAVQASTANTSSGAALIREITLDAPEVCPHYTAICIKGVKVGPSPQWLRAALEAIGQRSINNIVDVTNYVLHETCQPLHAFDAAKIRGGKLQVRMATEGEVLTTLDDKPRTLSADMAVIADAERALVIAGVMGSLDAEVDESTTDIVLEAAYFNPSSIRTTSRKLGLSTDSSYRFERGIDPQGAEYAALRATDLILELAGGRVDGPMRVRGQFVETVNEIQIKPDRICTFIGFDVPAAEMRQAFESLELGVAEHRDGDGSLYWQVRIPSFRGDLQREVDLIEEFVRIYGTENIPESPVVVRGISHADHRIYTVNAAMADYLSGQNFDEAYLYSLRESAEVEYLFGADSIRTLALANPLQSDQSHLRPSLIPGLLDVLTLNQARRTGATRFFERGHVYRAVQGALLELISVGFVILADPVRREWRRREPADFYTARTLSANILEIAGIAADKLSFKPIHECTLWQGGQSASAGDIERMGFECSAGLLAVETLKNRWDLKQPVIAGSILLTPQFFERTVKLKRHRSISNQPASVKDLALVVDQAVLARQVQSDIAKFAQKAVQGFVCEDVYVFDVYAGEGLPVGSKSLAVTMSFRAADRTLKDKEVNAAFEYIQQQIIQKTAYTLRK